jgi:hypothetical protein
VKIIKLILTIIKNLILRTLGPLAKKALSLLAGIKARIPGFLTGKKYVRLSIIGALVLVLGGSGFWAIKHFFFSSKKRVSTGDEIITVKVKKIKNDSYSETYTVMGTSSTTGTLVESVFPRSYVLTARSR